MILVDGSWKLEVDRAVSTCHSSVFVPFPVSHWYTYCYTTLTQLLSHPLSPSQPVCLQNWVKLKLPTLSRHSPSLSALWMGSCLACQCNSESYSGRLTKLTAVAVSTSSGYDWVCRGNGTADEFRPPRGVRVMEGWEGRLDSYWTVLGICSLKIVFFELCFFLILSFLF